MAQTIRQALQEARRKLQEVEGAEPALDSDVLLSHVTGLDRAGLYREWDCALPVQAEKCFWELIERRRLGEPVAYLTGCKEFMGLEFKVSPSVLIPRPETELLVETALALLPPAPLVIDVGTGSGAIAISLASFLPDSIVYATDRSGEALKVARDNAEKIGVGARLRFYQGDLLAPLNGVVPAKGADLIAANLPYIPSDGLAGLPWSVRQFEPMLALDGGAGGLELYRRLIHAAAIVLKNGGLLLLEIGFDQARDMLELLKTRWEADVVKDLAGLDRLVVARLCAGDKI
ncbi:MAG: peptide chain release factor N(5)-glutamine methyltransferase [Desulfotomaculaceae bacterium]|nr:peptide chain release factor N(5)-glutamine methyltransferase [Desulfotomaculaceae bacterium]